MGAVRGRLAAPLQIGEQFPAATGSEQTKPCLASDLSCPVVCPIAHFGKIGCVCPHSPGARHERPARALGALPGSASVCNPTTSGPQEQVAGQFFMPQPGEFRNYPLMHSARLYSGAKRISAAKR